MPQCGVTTTYIEKKRRASREYARKKLEQFKEYERIALGKAEETK